MSETKDDVERAPIDDGKDAYSAETVIRDVPREALDAIREEQKTSEKRRAAEQNDTPAEEQPLVSEESAEEKKAEEKSPVAAASPKAPEKNATGSDEKKPAAIKTAHGETRALAPPVTLGELAIAFAAAVALIIVGFYVIGSAF